MHTLASEPLAIIGMGCRFPGGVTDAESYWRLLSEGVDAVTEIPEDRWLIDAFYDPSPGVPGRSYSKWGGFLKDIDRFEPACFQLSPREAANMDPQQRLLLEVAWEALDDAGLPVERVAGSRTGVFVAVSMLDYQSLQSTPTNLRSLNSMTAPGNAMSIAANRLSYCFDLRGPSTVVDTACSSSLVAVDCAVRNMRDGKCDMAIVGGVNLLISPHSFVSFSAASMLSPDGRCKAFDARANGFVRAEGAGVVILKPLSNALADGDAVHALLLGSSLNQDGRTGGISMPNGEAQEAMLREMYAELGIDPASVAYVEAHGTGTAVGDPTEAHALGTVFGADRPPDRPLRIGSVKTNLGHLEAASGLASIIKAVLVLERGVIPRSLHFSEPNPNIPFDDLRLRVVADPEPLPSGDGPAVIGVNSFGFGGTNGHTVLSAFHPNGRPELVEHASHDDSPYLFTLTARSPRALQTLAETYAALLANDTPDADAFADVCYSLNLRKSHHAHRLSAPVRTPERAAKDLRAFAAGEAGAGIHTGEAMRDVPGLAFVFSGQGPQWWGMGQALFRKEPVYREALEACHELVQRVGGWSLLDEMQKDEAQSRMEQTAIAQPALFALQVGLARWWADRGIEPAAVVGHSVGEIAAAHVSGALSLEDAVRVVVHRGRCMNEIPANGRMLAVGLSPDDVSRYATSNGIALAAVNAPSMVTLSGNASSLEAVAARLEQDGVFHKFLRVRHAFHSAAMDPIRNEILPLLADIEPRPSAIPMVSTVSGEVVAGETLTADYWWENIRQPVRFADAVTWLSENGYGTFLEVAPHPVLSGSVTQCCRAHGHPAVTLPSLRRDADDEQARVLGSLGALFTMGYPVAWERLWNTRRRCVRLLRHPWQRESFWNECPDIRRNRLPAEWHPLLGHRIRGAEPVWEEYVDIHRYGYLQDHVVNGNVIFPAAAFVEMGLAAARMTAKRGDCVLEDVHLQKALFLAEDAAPLLQVRARPDEAALAFHGSLSGDPATWSRHCIASWCPASSDDVPLPLDVDAVRRRLPEMVPGENCYAAFHAMHLDFGPAFRGLQKAWRKDGEALGEIRVPDSLRDKMTGYAFHPALLDACFQVAIAALPADTRAGLMMPGRIARVQLFGAPTDRMWSHLVVKKSTRFMLEASMRVYADDGAALLAIDGLRLHRVHVAADRANEDPAELLYEFHWHDKPLVDGAQRSRSATYIPATDALADAALCRAGHIRRAHDQRDSVFNDPQMTTLTHAYLVQAFRRLGVRLRRGDELALDALMEKGGIRSEHRRVTRRFLSHLEACGTLEAVEADRWLVRKTPPEAAPWAIWRELLVRRPLEIADLRLLELTGPHLAEILKGDMDPLAALFPGGSIGPLESIYQDALVFRVENALMQAVMEQIVDMLPPGETLRILEVGAGTGGLTSLILPSLPARRTQYVFSDVSPMFLSKAEERFYAYPFVRYQNFDIDKDPQEQGLAPQSFDVILASDVFHAARDLAVTFEHIRGLLSANGLLLFDELQIARITTDLVFGLTEGWWRFTDYDRRPDHPLMSGESWARLLEEVGFADVQRLSALYTDGEPFHVVLLAKSGANTAERDADENPSLQLEVKDATAPDEAGGRWLIFADAGNVAERLAHRFQQEGVDCVLVRAGDGFARVGEGHYTASPTNPEDMLRILDIFNPGENGHGLTGVVHLWGLDAAPPDRMTPIALAEAEQRGCHSVMHLMQAMSSRGHRMPGPLVLVTAGAQAIGLKPGALSIGQAPLLGLGRVIKNEFTDLAVKRVDLFPDSDDDIDCLFREIRANDCEEEVVWRSGNRFVPRMERAPAEPLHPVSDRACEDGPSPFRLTQRQPGALDALTFEETTRREPGRGEVELAVHAAALNFRDLMRALGLLEADDEVHMLLGDEGAGVVTRVGPGVTRFRIGDRVFGQGFGTIASHTTAIADCLIPIPDHLNEYEAVTMPIAFYTAYCALHSLARMQRGDRVLIHSAAGGVGLAALQLAQRADAVVFATAGTDEKRTLLKQMGVRHVMDSRSLAFADEVMEATEGRGVDIVLNSLAGQGLVKSLACLAANGRFVELGKRDFYQNSAIGLWPFRKNITFYAMDLAQMVVAQPSLPGELARGLERRISDGSFGPLPARIMGASRVAEAFRYMSRGRHTGKIVVDMRDSNVKVARPKPDALRFDPDATYLITGGFGGFGLAVAEWIVSRGGRHLVLLSRRGSSTPEAQQAVRRLEKAGANVLAPACDVASPEQVESVMEQIDRTMPPLKGVFHTAMVVDDCTLIRVDAQRFHDVMRPKVIGTWNLHQATCRWALDHFVLFSSFSSVTGTHGQANYVAANAFIDAFASYRQSMGLPGAAVAWGVLGEVGYMAQRESLTSFVAERGVTSMTPEEALAALEETILRGAARTAAGRFDWDLMGTHFNPDPERGNLMSDLTKDAAAKQGSGDAGNKLGETILRADPDMRLPIADQYVRERVAHVLKMPANRIDSRARLSELGLDSLMAIELASVIESDLGVTFSMGKMTQDMTIQGLASTLVELLGGGQDGGAARTTAPSPEAPRCLLSLRDGNGAAPLFCFHGAGGDLAVYRPLAELLPSEITLWGLQSRLLAAEAREHASFTDMANEYVDAIMHVQPDGPYRLLGFSVGSLVAVNAAAKLERRGRAVAFVGLIDPILHPGDDCASQRAHLAHFIQAAYAFLERQAGVVKPIAADRLEPRAARLADAMMESEARGRSGELFVDWLERDGLMRDDIEPTLAREYVTRLETHIALLATDPGPPTVEAVLDIWPARDSFLRAAATNANGGKVRIHDALDGDHFSIMFAPHVSELAKHVAAALSASRSDAVVG